MSRLKLLACLAVASVGSLILAGSASALPFTVNTNSTDTTDAIPGNGVCEVHTGGDDCTLSAAMEETNATVAADTIDFSVPGPFTLFSAKAINNPLTIDGNGSGVDGTVVRGRDFMSNPDTHALFTAGAAVTFRDLRLEDGGRTGGGTGGAVFAQGDTTFDNVTLTSNQITGGATGVGGAIYNGIPAATTTLINSTVSDNMVSTGANDAFAGGIYTAGTLVLTDSTVSGNTVTGTAQTRGAGIYADGALSIVRSAVTGNTITAGGMSPQGGGVFGANLAAGAKAITNSTISGNSAGTGTGGGLRAATSMAITSTTFASNSGTAGGADIYTEDTPTVTVKNTILASTASAPCLQTNVGTIVSAMPGSNIDVGTSCGFGTSNGNQQNTDPLLGPLALNAPGTTETHAITSGSPAFNSASADCGGLGTDQRGVPRPQPTGGACDIGAFELEVATPAPITPVQNPPASTPASKTCPKGKKLKKGKCVKKKKKKK